MAVETILKQEDRILREIELVLRGYKTVNSQQKVVYNSHFVTAGPRLYEAFRQHGVSRKEDLPPGVYRNDVMNPNLVEGIDFGEEIKARGHTVIVPGDFFAKGWADKHYMSLWEQVIKKHADIVCFYDKFHCSMGCVEELLIGFESGKELRHRNNFAPLNPNDELPKIRTAIDDLDSLGVDPSRLYDSYRRLSLSVN